MTMPPCVVVGLEQNGLGVVRALGRAGVQVIAVADDRPRPQTATRFARVVHCPDLRDVRLINTLEAIAAESPVRPVLIATMDRTVTLLAEHREKIDSLFRHSLPSNDVIQRLMSKAETDAFSRASGFLVPRTFAVRCEAGLENVAREVGFPCIVKPQVKTVEFVERTPKKAFLVADLDELIATYTLVSQWERDVVVQEWVPGPDTKLVFCLYYFDSQGSPLAWFTGRKVRQYIPYCGTASSAEPWRDDTARDEGLRFFGLAGYRGFGAIEFKIDPAGRYHLIEPTVGRTEHIFALAAANGVNLAEIGYRDMAGLQPKPWALTSRARIYMDWKRDLRAARHYISLGELTWGAFLKSAIQPRQHALFAWDDPVPIARQAALRTFRAARGIRRRVEATTRQATDWASHARAQLQTRRQQGELQSGRSHAEAAVAWLCAAQDATGCGGVSRGYSVSRRSGYGAGWQPAYPETTGYIIPTFYECATAWDRGDLADRAGRMAEWLLTVQLPNGGFPGGTIERRAPAVVFNTGMILLGLSRTYKETGDCKFADAAARAVEFLLQAQSPDGAWRRFTSASGQPAVHCYDLLVCTGLLSAADWLDRERIHQAIRGNLDFSLTLQRPNGWLAQNGTQPSHHAHPPTHTMGYAAAGWLECGMALQEPRYVAAARLVADALVVHVGPDGHLAGQFDQNWRPAAGWCCLTGNVQMAAVWRTLYGLEGEAAHGSAARRSVDYVKRCQPMHGEVGIRGGIAGSAPLGGRYGRYQYVNWAAKFFVDALLQEERAA
jgi:predicted ATP-grasp superfamily ATP-dependent carboligase